MLIGRLFVYGTLRTGGSNHGVLAGIPGAEYIGLTRTCPGYRLCDIGPFPGMVRAPGSEEHVIGEIWGVGSWISVLDMFEGHPHLFRRETVHTLKGDMEAYFWQEPGDHRPSIKGGDWLEWVTPKEVAS